MTEGNSSIDRKNGSFKFMCTFLWNTVTYFGQMPYWDMLPSFGQMVYEKHLKTVYNEMHGLEDVLQVEHDDPNQCASQLHGFP